MSVVRLQLNLSWCLISRPSIACLHEEERERKVQSVVSNSHFVVESPLTPKRTGDQLADMGTVNGETSGGRQGPLALPPLSPVRIEMPDSSPWNR